MNEISIEIEQYYKQIERRKNIEINNVELAEIKKQIDNSDIKINSHGEIIIFDGFSKQAKDNSTEDSNKIDNTSQLDKKVLEVKS